MNLSPSLGLDINAKQDNASALCFHPHKNIINVASGNEIFVCDLSSKHVIAKLSIEFDPAATITHLYQASSHNFLVAATDGGSVYVWEMNRRTLVSEHHDVERKPISCMAGSVLVPAIFFSRVSSKDVNGLDLRPSNISNANLKFKGSKKSIQSIACHPTKHVTAAVGSDGILKVWDYQTQSLLNTLDDLAVYEASKGIQGADKYVVAFEPREGGRLICVGTNGVVLGWSDVWGDQPRVVLNCVLKTKSKIVNIAYHPTQPILVVLLANGSVTGWELWQNELHPSGYLPDFSLVPHESNKFTHIPSYAQRPPFSGAPTQFLIHPSAKYFTFLWDSSILSTVSIGPQPAPYLPQSHSTGSLVTSGSSLAPSSSTPNVAKAYTINITPSASSSSLNTLARLPSASSSSSLVRTLPLSTSSSAIPRPLLSANSPAVNRPALSNSAPFKLIHSASSAAILPPAPLVASQTVASPGAAGQVAGGLQGSTGIAASPGGAIPTASGAALPITNAKRVTVRQLVYTYIDTSQPLTTLPLMSLVQPQLGFFYEEKQSFIYPKDAVYFDNNAAMAHYFIKGVSVKLVDLPPPKGDMARDLVRAIRFTYSPKQQSYMVFYEVTRHMSGETYKCLISSPNLGFPAQYEVAQDGFFFGREEDEMLLLVGGTYVHVAPVSFLEWNIFKLGTTVARVFKSPLGEGRIVMYFDKKEKRLIFSHPETYMPDPSKGFLPLADNESVVEVVWQGETIAAVLTTTRLVVINSSFQTVAQVDDTPASFPLISFWNLVTKWVLLYTTDTHLKYMTLDGKIYTLRSLDRDKIVLSSILPDRVLYGHRNYAGVPHDPDSPPPAFPAFGVGVGGWGTPGGGLGGCTTVHNHAVGLLEPLLMGLFSPPSGVVVEDLQKKLAFVISRFDTGRVTQRVLDRLLETGHPDAAFQLVENSSRYSADFRFTLAFNAKLFEKAFGIASGEYEKSKDARYRARLLAVGQAATEEKKFELARKAFEQANDPFALLNLYVVANHRSGLLLLRKLAEEQSDKFTTVLIDKILTKSPAQERATTLSNTPPPPLIYSPTSFINVSMRMGGEFLSPLNLNSLSRWLTTANAATISATAPQQAPLSARTTNVRESNSFAPVPASPSPVATPVEPPAQSQRIVPPKRFGNMRANQQKLSTKTTLSSSSTLRRTPSTERLVVLPTVTVPHKKLIEPLEAFLAEDDEIIKPNGIIKQSSDKDIPPAAEKQPLLQADTKTDTPNESVQESVEQFGDTQPKGFPAEPPAELPEPLPQAAPSEPSTPSKPAELAPTETAEPASKETTKPGEPQESTKHVEPAPVEPTALTTEPGPVEPKEPTELEEQQPHVTVEPKEPTVDVKPTSDQQEPTEPTTVTAEPPQPTIEPIEPTESTHLSATEPAESNLPEMPAATNFLAHNSPPSTPTSPDDPSRRYSLAESLEGIKYPSLTNYSASTSSAYFSEFPAPYTMAHFALTASKSNSFLNLGSAQDQLSQKKLQAATDKMKSALLSLEKGAYDESLEDVAAAAKMLTSGANPDTARREVRLCVAYSLALRMLRKLKQLEEKEDANEAASMSTYLLQKMKVAMNIDYQRLLATIPLQPKHRVVILRMAILKNLAVHNYGTAARIVELLLTLELPDQVATEDKWVVCYEKNFVDAAPINLPAKLCFLTLNPLKAASTACHLCAATFSEAAAPENSSCPYCSSGELQELIFTE